MKYDKEISCATCLLSRYTSRKIGKRYQEHCESCGGYPEFKKHIEPAEGSKKEWNYKEEGYTNTELKELCSLKEAE